MIPENIAEHESAQCAVDVDSLTNPRHLVVRPDNDLGMSPAVSSRLSCITTLPYERVICMT